MLWSSLQENKSKMSIGTISKKLVELLRKREFIRAQKELFDLDVIRIEPDFHPQVKIEGLSKILQKENEFITTIKTWHEHEVSEPVVGKDYFCIRMFSKLQMYNGQLLEIDELIVYQVSNEKIIKEQFFYDIPKKRKSS